MDNKVIDLCEINKIQIDVCSCGIMKEDDIFYGYFSQIN